jgi:hypothetical protein
MWRNGGEMKISENFLYHIWEAQHLTNNLKTVSGKNLKITYSGRFSYDAGPDFRDAIIEISGKKLKGDIEIDKNTYNWKSHHHHENKKFNNVILHIVFKNNLKDIFTINEDGEPIEIFEMESFIEPEISKLLKTYSTKKFIEKEKKCPIFENKSLLKTEDMLRKLGMMRFENKVKRFKTEHYFYDFDQLLFQGIFEALGYSKNKYQMLKLAQNIKYKQLKTLFGNGMTRDEMISYFLCSSGLIAHFPKNFPNEIIHKWITLFREDIFAKYDYNWQLFRIRPANHPAVRIAQLSKFLYNSFETSIFQQIAKIFSIPSNDVNLEKFKKNLYTLFRQKSDFLPEKYVVGKSRIDAIFINVILPLIITYAREKNYENLEDVAIQIYENHKSLAENYVSKYMKLFMNIEQKKMISRKEILQQGILKLYFNQCKEHDCAECEMQMETAMLP